MALFLQFFKGMKKLVLIITAFFPLLAGCGDEPPCSSATDDYTAPFSATDFSVPITKSCRAALGSGVGYGDLTSDQVERAERDLANFR